MGWKGFLSGLKRSRQKESGRPHHAKNATVRPTPREYRSPTTGELLSHVHRDYYVLVYDPSYPSFVWDEPDSRLIDLNPAGDPETRDMDKTLSRSPLPLRLSPAANGSTALVDWHLSNTPVVSEPVVRALAPYQMTGVEFFPTQVRTAQGATSESYFALYIDQEIACLDDENSRFQAEDDGSIVVLEKIALKADALEAIDLENRLLFKLAESGREYLFHRKLVSAITQQGFKGACFVSVEDWRLSEASYHH